MINAVVLSYTESDSTNTNLILETCQSANKDVKANDNKENKDDAQFQELKVTVHKQSSEISIDASCIRQIKIYNLIEHMKNNKVHYIINSNLGSMSFAYLLRDITSKKCSYLGIEITYFAQYKIDRNEKLVPTNDHESFSVKCNSFYK